MKSSAFLWVLLIATAAAGQGVPPLASASQYAVSARGDHFTVGAQQLSKKQVRKGLIPEVNRRYLVIEVGVFPDAGTTVTLSPDEFEIRTLKGFTLRPMETRDVAEYLVAPNGWDRTTPPNLTDIETPFDRPDRRKVSTGDIWGHDEPLPRRAREEAGVRWKEKELDQKVVPEETVSTPTGGYLFFIARPKKPTTCELRFTVDSRTVVLVLPLSN